jgi:acetyl-CoA carboxylase carboxyl transferase subunit beta
MLFNKQLDKALRVCMTCGHHFRLSAAARLDLLLDPGTWAEHDAGLQSVDRLGFVDQKPYPDRLVAAQTATGMRDAAVWGTGALGGTTAAMCVMDFGFMGGSMGAVVGEKVTRAAEYALVTRTPLVIVSASGGARMQEGTLALMQLAKTMAALERLRSAGVPFVSVLSDPTTGGVFASFAAVGDVNVAEPNALIGFAGSRVSAGAIACVVHAVTLASLIARRHLPIVITTGMLSPSGMSGSENLPASSVTVCAIRSPGRSSAHVVQRTPGWNAQAPSSNASAARRSPPITLLVGPPPATVAEIDQRKANVKTRRVQELRVVADGKAHARRRPRRRFERLSCDEALVDPLRRARRV